MLPILLLLCAAAEPPQKPEPVYTQITVTTSRLAAEDAATSPQIVTVKDADSLRARPLTNLGAALAEAPGILAQQTTTGQSSPFLRGLTGYHVLNLLDGLRFNNSTFRSGPNQYLAWLEPSQADKIEAMLGPASALYGSDALGGTLHVLTPTSLFDTAPTWRGDFTLGGASADLSPAANARISRSKQNVFFLFGASGRRHNDLRAGHADDSHNVYRRLFGLSSSQIQSIAGDRLEDTAFSQYGLQSKLALRIPRDQSLTLYFQRGQQLGVRGYKDLMGGLGRMISDFEPQTLNWFHSRYEKRNFARLDTLSATFSLNSQADGSARQNLLSSGAITRDWSRVDSYGYTTQATTHIGSRIALAFGGEAYDEHIGSTRAVNSSAARPLYPNDSRYLTSAAFTQASANLSHGLRAAAGARFTAVRFSTPQTPAYSIPASANWYRDTTFQASLSWQAAPVLGFHTLVSRGFRAPNLNDLASIGLNDLGYEIPSAEAIPAGALLSTDSGESALSKGAPLTGLKAESVLNYEAGFRIQTRRVYARAQVFDSELADPIVRRTLLFPANSVPTSLAGLAVKPIPQTAAQAAQGVVAVATSIDPRAVKAFTNDGASRYNGVESLIKVALPARWSLEANYTFLGGRDLNPNRNIRRLPPQSGSTTLRYAPSGRRLWFETQLALAGAQRRLSGGDIDDERIGASRRRRDIADFFNGSRVQALTANGVFTPTGETLRQIQDRVLPLGSRINGVTISSDDSRAPLYLSTPGWAALHLRAGFPLTERLQLMAALENTLDKNYRAHGSGVDAPGRNAWLSLRYSF